MAIFQAQNGLKVTGWVDADTGRLLNGETLSQKQDEYEAQNQGKLTGEITDLRTDKVYDIKKDYTLHVLVSGEVKAAYVQLLNATDQGAEQFIVDLSTGTAKILIKKDHKYDCYLYLVGESGTHQRIYQGGIEFRNLTEWDKALFNCLKGIFDAIVDNVTSIIKAIFHPIQTVKALGFALRSIIPGTKERQILDKMVQENVGDWFYELLNEFEIEEASYAVGYMAGEIIFAIITSGVSAKGKEVVSKVKTKLKEVFDFNISDKAKKHWRVYSMS